MMDHIPPTLRLYLQDDHCFETEALILVVRENEVALDRTCFHPGGGGQPPDAGSLILPNNEIVEIGSARIDADEVIWHRCRTNPASDLIGQTIQLKLDQDRRLALMRYHTVLHVLNTIALRDYGGWITGVQIGTDYSRIDFKLEHVSPALSAELEHKVNLILAGDHALKSFYIPEQEFRNRNDLLRTLTAQPPISHGQVRVVEIEGFDAQACGGTHMHNTNEVGKLSIFRIDNKGKNNKRFYIRLDPSRRATE
jgi:misacylated tRNA(Ala) deacylase